jgi:DNA polymerase-1
VSTLIRYAKLVSRRNMYTKVLPELVGLDGRVRPSLWATGVRSGRFSCSNPNMQGISKDHAKDDPAQIREVFVPKKGNVLTAADYSQIELRIAACLARFAKWCDGYRKGDVDIHRQTAADMFHVPIDKVTKDQRDIAKTTNFSILTGITAKTLSARNRKTMPTTEDAQMVMDRWAAACPELCEWTERVMSRVYRDGYSITHFGRIRPFPDVNNPAPARVVQLAEEFANAEWAAGKSMSDLMDTARRSLARRCERKALSHRIQGTAADIMKMAIVCVYRDIKKSKLPIRMLLTVHDELLFEHPPRITKKVHALLRKAMEFRTFSTLATADKPEFPWVPFTIDIGTGKNWNEAH